jgi:hypothetical protein
MIFRPRTERQALYSQEAEKPKRKRYTYVEPYYVVKCNNGYLALQVKCYGKTKYFRAYCEEVQIKHRRNVKGEWESYAYCNNYWIIKRKRKESAEKQVEKALDNFGKTRIPDRFLGAKIVLIDVPWNEYIAKEYKNIAEADQIEQRRKHNY